MRKINSSLFLVAAAKRAERGITLDQIATTTKISVRSLRAIEEGDFQKLPGGIYNTSYIKQYARAVKVDEVELVAAYEEAIAPPAGKPAESKPVVSRFRPAMLQG